MTRIILALASIALVFSVACGGSDDKNGGLLGGGNNSSSSSGSNTKDPVAFAQAALTTSLNVFGGSVDPQKYLDLYLPECSKGIKASDVTATLAMVKGLFPDLNKLKVEDVDLAGPKVEKNGNDYKLTVSDVNKVRVKTNGKFVNGAEFMKSIGFTDPGDSPLEGLQDPVEIREQDGRLYFSTCDDLQDIAAAAAPTPTPQRGNATATPRSGGATATPQRSGVATPTPNRTQGTIGRDIATPQRGTPVVNSTVTTLVKSTPTAAQRYPDALQKEFMDDCTGTGAAQSTCRCMLDLINTRYDVAGYREFEKAIQRNERQAELTAIVSACTR